jgi:hypothetical protein
VFVIGVLFNLKTFNAGRFSMESSFEEITPKEEGSKEEQLLKLNSDIFCRYLINLSPVVVNTVPTA